MQTGRAGHAAAVENPDILFILRTPCTGEAASASASNEPKQFCVLRVSVPSPDRRGTKHLDGLKGLNELRLNCKIVGTGLKDLAGLTNLRALDFSCRAELTDEGLANVKRFSKLEQLRLIGAPNDSKAAVKDVSEVTAIYGPHE